MSLKKTPSQCFVIDASIARAAGGFESLHPVGIQCRDFLQKIRGVCHRMAWNGAIKAEWDRHQSNFTKTWFVSMFNLGKIRKVADAPRADFREAVVDHSPSEGSTKAMLKDAHLIEAALETDRRIASLDEVARGHFSRLSGAHEDLSSIHWTNPASEQDGCLEWLEAGAPEDAARRLRK